MFSTLNFKFCHGVYKRGQKYNVTNLFITVFFKMSKKVHFFISRLYKKHLKKFENRLVFLKVFLFIVITLRF